MYVARVLIDFIRPLKFDDGVKILEAVILFLKPRVNNLLCYTKCFIDDDILQTLIGFNNEIDKKACKNKLIILLNSWYTKFMLLLREVYYLRTGNYTNNDDKERKLYFVTNIQKNFPNLDYEKFTWFCKLEVVCALNLFENKTKNKIVLKYTFHNSI